MLHFFIRPWRNKVRVNYRSGHSEVFWVKEFKFEYPGTCSWDGAWPYPMVLNPADVESIWVLS